MVKLLLIIAIVLHLPAVTMCQTITLSAKQITLPAAFAEIKKQTNYAVVFNPRVLDTVATISINAKNQSLESFLKAILAKQSLRYRIVGTTIIVSGKENKSSGSEENDDSPIMLVSDELHGVIIDKGVRPLSGVSVVLKRTGKGTQTDVKGMFTLKGVGDKDTVVCSMIGYQTTALPAVKREFPLIVTMNITVSELDVAVVKAFGVTSNRLATGSITRISGEEIRRQPVMNPLLALQGRVPGMVITPTSGYASSPVKVEIRGRNTLNKNFSGEPLYVVDGVPRVVLDVSNGIQRGGSPSPGPVQGGVSFTGGQSILYGMNPNDIESIEVLRDGDATALYGSRAANGVVLITTKKAKAGRTAFTMDIAQGISVVPRNVKMMNTQQYLQMRREAFRNDGITPTPENAPDLTVWDTTRYTDWQKELLNVGKNTRVSAQLTAGDDRNNFFMSAMYVNRTGMTQQSGKDELAGFNTNLVHKSLDQKLTVSLRAGYSYVYTDAVDLGGNFTMAPNGPPIFNEKDELNYAEWNVGTTSNRFEFARLLQPSVSKTNMLQSSLNISYEIMKGLEFSTLFGYSNSQNVNDFSTPIVSQDPALSRVGVAVFSNSRSANWSVNPRLDYSRMISRGRLGITLGASYENQSTRAVTSLAVGYDNDELMGSIINASFVQTTDAEGLYRVASLFGVINYNWDNKYIINLNGRRDGSSRFAPDRQFGNFGSVGISWNASEEEWMKRLLPSWLSFLKFRGSSALTGSDAIGDYQYLSQWSGLNLASPTLRYDYNGIRAFVPLHAANQSYHWESNKKLEAAIRLGFLKDRINVELIAYRNITDKALVTLPTPVYSGFSSVVANSAAKVANKGLEFIFSARLMENKNFSWSAGFNISTNKNKLLAYPGLEYSPHASVYRVGYSTTVEFLLHYIGVDPLTGIYSFEDYGKDGVVMFAPLGTPGTNGDDRYIVLDKNPKYDGGFHTDLTYRDISLRLQFIFRKALVTDPLASTIPGSMYNLYMPDDLMNNHWRKPGDLAKYPGFSTGAPGTLGYSDGQYTDGSYLKLNNISLSWRLPDNLVKKAGMQSCDFSVEVNNVFVITKYKGVDPVVGTLSGPPPPRIINGKIVFTF